MKETFQRVMGIVLPERTIYSNSFYREVILNLQIATMAHDYGLLLFFPRSEKPTDWKTFLSSVSAIVDGFLVVAPLSEDPFLTELRTQEKSKPAVILFNRSPHFSSVCLDNESAVFTALSHLRNLGHKKIAFITGDLRTHDAKERMKAYQQYMHSFGFPYNPDYVVEGGFDYSAGKEAMIKLLALPERPTAVFAANDRAAIGAVESCAEKEVTVPGGVAIIGCDDVPVDAVKNKLSTIRQPLEKIASEAVVLLMDEIENQGQPSPKKEISVEGELIVRESCGLPPHLSS